MSNLRSYVKSRGCSKCGSIDEHPARYVPKKGYHCGNEEEYLLRICTTCRFKWKESCIEAKPVRGEWETISRRLCKFRDDRWMDDYMPATLKSIGEGMFEVKWDHGPDTRIHGSRLLSKEIPETPLTPKPAVSDHKSSFLGDLVADMCDADRSVSDCVPRLFADKCRAVSNRPLRFWVDGKMINLDSVIHYKDKDNLDIVFTSVKGY